VVDKTGDMKPSVNDPNYKALLKERLNKSLIKENQLKPLQSKKGQQTDGSSIRRQLGTEDLIQTVNNQIIIAAPGKPSSRNRSKDKRVRMKREQLETMILTLFDKKDYYTFKEMLTQTDQPAAFLKEMLTEMCEKITSGPHIHEFRLKETYRVSGDSSSSSTGDGESSVKTERASLNDIFK